MSLEGNKSDFDSEMKVLAALIADNEFSANPVIVERMKSALNEWTCYLKPSIEDTLSKLADIMLEDE